MGKEATKSALSLIEENKFDINDIEGTGINGKVTVSDVERYMAEMADESESKEDTDSENSPDDGSDSETEESTDESPDDKGEDADKSESEAPKEPEESKSDDNESKSEPESGGSDSEGDGELICRFTIKGQTKPYKPGDVYKGNSVEHLLKRGAIYRR